MIESRFHRRVGAKAIGSSGHHSDFIVEALDRAVGDFAFGSKPIKDEVFVRAEHAGDFAHGLDPAAESALTPDIQEGSGPSERAVAPEVLEGLFEHPSPAGGQLAVQEAQQFAFGFATDAAAAAEQFPTHAFEAVGLGPAVQSAVLGPAHFVDRLVEMRGNVEAIQDVQGVRDLGGEDAQVGLPHVAADEAQTADDLGAQRGQAPAQGGLRAALPHPKQAAAVGVDLVDDRQEVLGAQALAPVDLIHAEGFDPFELAMGQAPLNEPVDRTVDGFPTGLEGLGGFAPRQAAGPAGQKDHHRDGDGALAVAPGNVLDADAVLGALNATRGVVEVGGDVPQERKEPGPFGQVIIARRRFQALGTFAIHGGMGLQMNVNVQVGTVFPEPDIPVNEARKMLKPVQNRLNVKLHSGSFSCWFVLFFTKPQTNRTAEDPLCNSALAPRRPPRYAVHGPAEDKALRGRNLSADRILHPAAGLGGWLHSDRPVPSCCRSSLKAKNPRGFGGQRPPFHTFFTHKFCDRALNSTGVQRFHDELPVPFYLFNLVIPIHG